MGIFLVYSIKSALLLSLFYLLNRLLLEKETFHRLNRALWILIIPLSYILTFVGFRKDIIDSSVFGEDSLAGVINPGLITFDSSGSASLMATIVVILLGLGSLVLTIIWIINLIKLKKGLSKSTSSYVSLMDECKIIAGVEKKVDLYLVTRPVVPSSWMNNIIISETDIKENGREILLHELSHIKHGHSWDILLADILIIIQWFNPASWLLKRAIRQVHEYQADDEVIKSGINAKQYQLLLIEKAVGKRLYSMANSFNHSKLKNRITMMFKKRSNKWAYAKCLYILPLAFIAVSAFAVPEVSSKMEEISNLEFTRIVLNASQKTENIFLNEQDPPLFIVDGNEVDIISDIPIEAIESVSVLKDKIAVTKYGEKGRNGVLEITLKEIGTYDAESGYDFNIRNRDNEKMTEGGDLKFNSVAIVRAAERTAGNDTVRADLFFGAIPSEDAGIIVRGTGTYSSGNSFEENQELLYIVDGKEVPEISGISQTDIESVTVLNDKEAVGLYGEKGKDGVIIITLKKQ